MSDSGQETPTEYGEWIEDDLDWDDISEKFNSERSTAIVIAVVSLIIGIFGLAANSQIITFYWKRRDDLVPSLYITLSCTDFLVSLTAVLHFIAMLLVVEAEPTQGLTIFLAVVFTITTLILRVSVFVNVVLIVVRTINITRPFYQVNRTIMWSSVLTCILVLLPVIVYDTIRISDSQDYHETKVRYVFLPFVGDYAVRDIVMAVHDIKPGDKKVIMVPDYVTFATSGVPFCLAVLIALVCLVINCRELRASKTGLGKSGGGKTEQEITVTITLLTTVFSVCNTVYSVWMVLIWGLNLDYWGNQTVLQISYVTSSIFPFISSSLNPIILIWRSKTLRENLKRKLTCGKKVASDSSNTTKTYSTNTNSVNQTHTSPL